MKMKFNLLLVALLAIPSLSWTKEEIGEHMLGYPVDSVSKLDNEVVSQIWNKIKSDIEEINKSLKNN